MGLENVERTEKTTGGVDARLVAAARKPRTAKTTSAKLSTKKNKRNPRPPKAVRLSQSERRMSPRYAARPDRIGVSVTLNLPRIKGVSGGRRPKDAPKLLSRFPAIERLAQRLALPVRLRRPFALVLGLCLVVAVGFLVQAGNKTPGSATGTASAAVRTAPDFKPLVPSAAEASAQTYDGKRNLVTYNTTFSGARLTVSQQPLPARFGSDPKALSNSADSINAKQRLETARGPLYIATTEQGDQQAIFAGKQVLLFIHSERKLDDASWKAFIELLEAKS